MAECVITLSDGDDKVELDIAFDPPASGDPAEWTNAQAAAARFLDILAGRKQGVGSDDLSPCHVW